MTSSIILPILITFFLTLTLVTLGNKGLRTKPLFSTSPERKFNYRPVGWTALDYLALTTSVSMLALTYFLLLDVLGMKIYRPLAWAIISLICICTAIMATLYFNLIESYKKIATLLTILITTATIFIAIYSSILADGEIENLTGVEAAKFPNAQKVMTLTVTVAIWGYLLFWLSGGVTVIASAILLHRTQKSSHTGLNEKDQKGRSIFHAFNLLIGIIFFFSMYSSGFITALTDISKKRLKPWLVESSFHFSPEHCGIREKPMDSKVALIGDQKAVLATSSLSEIYRFDLIACPQATEPKPAY